MSDAKRLKDKLGLLAGAENRIGPAGRALPAAEDARQPLLAEIDETILGRKLVFTNEAGDVLELEVSGRRLLRVVSAPEGCVSEARRQDLLTPLAADDDDQLGLVSACIGAFVRGSRSLSVAAAPLERRPDPSVAGRTAEAFAAAMGIDLYAARPAEAAPPASEADPAPPAQVAAPQPAGDAVEDFLVLVRPRALAIARIAPDGTFTSEGAPDQAKALEHLAEGGDAALAAQLVTAGAPCLLLRTAEAGAPFLFYGMRNDVRLAILCPGELMGDLRDIWRSFDTEP